MSEPILSAQVKDYLKGNLTASEKEIFENALSSDPALQREVALQRAEMAAAELMIASDSRRLFAEWKKEAIAPQKTGFAFKRKHWFFLIAGICSLAAIGLFFYRFGGDAGNKESAPTHDLPVITPSDGSSVQAPGKATSEPSVPAPISVDVPEKPSTQKEFVRLARENFKEPVFPNFRSGKNADNTSYVQQASEAYTAGHYEKVLQLLARPDTTRQQTRDFLIANALFHLDRYEEAAQKFSNLAASHSMQYQFQSEWSLVLCQIAGYPRQKQETLERLQNIASNPDHPYSRQAKKLRLQLQNR